MSLPDYQVKFIDGRKILGILLNYSPAFSIDFQLRY